MFAFMNKTKFIMNYSKPVTKLLFTLVTCLMLAFAVQCQTTFTQWTYEPLQGASTAPTPNLGSGTSTTVGSMTGATTGTGSSDGCSQTTGTSAWQIGTANPGTTNESSGIEFKTSTVGYENILFSYDHRISNTGSRTARIQYTLDGMNWLNYDLTNSNYSNSCAGRGAIDNFRIDASDPVGNNVSDSWSRRNIDFTSITGANNNANFGVRILAAHYSTTGQFRQANNVNTVATGGTWRLDNVVFKGNAIQVENPTVNLSVSANEGSEANTTEISVTATTSSNVSGNQTVDLTVTGMGITTGDYTLSNASITINSGSNTGSVSFTIVNDILVEGSETAQLVISNPSSGISLGSTLSQNIIIIDNDTPPLPQVNLSLNSNTGNEADATAITVTAIADAPVSGNQIINVQISGMDITNNDYYLSKNVITIPSGQTSGFVKFIIADDAKDETSETATVTLAAPTSGITLGASITDDIVIENNDCSMLTRTHFYNSANGAEISAFDPESDRLYTVAGNTVEYFSISNTGQITLLGNVNPGFTVQEGFSAIPNSVAIKNGILAASYAIRNNTTNAQDSGLVSFFNAGNATFIKAVKTGYLPDMVIFSPDGNKVLSANEGEPNSYNQGNSFDPEGSVSIIDISNGALNASVSHAGFTSYNGQIVTLRNQGIRIFGPNATVAQDFEPEYIAFKNDSIAVVSLQENNAFAFVNINTSTVMQIVPLGFKDHSLAGNGMDASDRDSTSSIGKINIQNWPVFGMFMPDALASYMVNGQTYFISANEGDARDYTGFAEEIRVGAGGYVLDPVLFPNAATLKLNANLGRLQLTNATGDTDNDGDKDMICALGARSFTVWDQNGSLVFDSGDQIEQITAQRTPTLFNSEGSASNFDSRSDNKGPEPEGMVIGNIDGVPYAFVGLERTGDIMVYNISNPAAPIFVQYINTTEDLAVEGLTFVSKVNSPTGNALLISTAEVSNTISVFEIGKDLYTYYADNDNDGYGDLQTAPVIICNPIAPEGFVNNFGDCNDGNMLVNPQAIEVCDEIDNNCDGVVDENCGCTNELAHNYDENATTDNGTCETCSDGIKNGDEFGVDCGGSLCPICPAPVASCGNIVNVTVTPSDLIYNGPGASDVYLIPALDLDSGTTSCDPNSLTRQVKRTLTNIGFNWTTNGACLDATPNGVYNNNDKGLVYRDCLPVAPADFNKIRNFDMTVSDVFGTSTCSGRYKVIYNAGGTNPELSAIDDFDFSEVTNLFNIYPNPGQNEINIELNFEAISGNNSNISIFDVLGKKVYSSAITSDQRFIAVNASSLASGSYNVIIRTENNMASKRWVKI